MNWTLDINIIIQVLSLTMAAGMGWQKLRQIEHDVERLEERLEKEIVDYRELKADLMVIKTQISNLTDKIDQSIKLSIKQGKEHLF